MSDIHSVLEVTVFDQDRDQKVDFLGKVDIPLLKVSSTILLNVLLLLNIYSFDLVIHLVESVQTLEPNFQKQYNSAF